MAVHGTAGVAASFQESSNVGLKLTGSSVSEAATPNSDFLR